MPRIPALCLFACLWGILGGCQSQDVREEEGKAGAPEAAQPWPRARAPLPPDPQLEARIDQLLAQMSLEQKVAQMIQADIGSITEADIREFRIGSVLNGGGQTPNNKVDASPREWAVFADKLFQASLIPEPGKVPIPLMWGVDAVHGHGNVVGATLFPHNIALGATRNPALAQKIAAATAVEVAATGIDWNFAPSVAVARDIRWGRTYESFSEDPALVAQMGAAVVAGLQGPVGNAGFLDPFHVLATAKHYIGDGGTLFGDDQGQTQGDEAELIRLHLPGYVAAIESGVQTIMASYSGWSGVNSHANKRLLTDLLKDHLGFDGFVVSDWQGIAHIHGCSIDSCPIAINAGVDLFMIPNAPDWKNFYRNTLAQVWTGIIPVSRIDDAVRRILRVKLRAGLWKKPSPAYRLPALQPELVGHPAHRELARQAVRESLVLLKNNGVLPLRADQTLLVAGPGADNLSMQSGGWSVTWQGRDVPNAHFPGATSVFAGIEQAARAAGGRALLSVDGAITTPVDAAIVVFGELPYAESNGDIQNLDTLELETRDKRALRLMRQLKSQGIPVVAVLLSGRPLWVNPALNAADAFVAAWQPGTEGAGVADVLLRLPDGKVNHDLKGRLPFSWPKDPCDAQTNIGDEDYAPLFPVGFGLTYESRSETWTALPEDTSDWPYGCRLGKALAPAETLVFTAEDGWRFHLEKPSLEGRVLRASGTSGFGALSARPETSRGLGIEARWDGSTTSLLLLRNGHNSFDFLSLYAQDAALVFDIRVTHPPKKPVEAWLFSGPLTGSLVDISATIRTLSPDLWHSLSIDLNCFAQDRADFSKVDVPFGLQTAGSFAAAIANVRYEPGRAATAQVRCPKP